jgi:hypothetical protein
MFQQEQKGKTGPVWGGVYQWKGENTRKGGQRVNIVEI